MNCVFVLSFVLALAVHGDVSMETNNNLDVCALVKNSAILKSVAECILSSNNDNCPPGADAIKSQIEGVVQSGCKTCSEDLKKKLVCVLNELRDKFPDLYEAIKNKYDPEEIYWDKFLAGINS